MSARSLLPETFEIAARNKPSPIQDGGQNSTDVLASARKPGSADPLSLHLVCEWLSPWSQSSIKRLFDFTCVLLALPALIPVFLVVSLAIRLTSRGPVLFLQQRVGRHGLTFTIVKFRTMMHSEDAAHNAVTTTENQRFTPVGPFLRRSKLDELPQLVNVLLGDMSLVGPRPKLLEHQIADLCCRPGITGAATIAFAREEQLLACLPDHSLDEYYHTIVLPAKLELDADYMARATFLSDLKLVVNSALRRWDNSVIDSLLNAEAFGVGDSRISRPAVISPIASVMVGNEDLVSAE